MDKRLYWQDYALYLGMFLMLVLLACVPGCGNSELPCGPKVLIFTANWCPFCPSLDQINQLQTDYPNCEVLTVNVDKHPEMVKEYHVTKIPRYFLCYEDGCQTTTSLPELRRWLSEL